MAVSKEKDAGQGALLDGAANSYPSNTVTKMTSPIMIQGARGKVMVEAMLMILSPSAKSCCCPLSLSLTFLLSLH